MPKTVRIAIVLIWVSLILSMLLTLTQKVLGDINLADCASALAVNALMLVIPYKLAQRSNMARIVFTGLFVLSILFLLAAGEELQVTALDKLDLLLNIPLNIYSIYLLFFNEPAQLWFEQPAVK